jgi:hypothetical protein
VAASNEVKLIISADGSGAIAVSKEVAEAYKTLGATTVADINAQKGQITAAYESIKTSGVASAEEIRHAEEAKTSAIQRGPRREKPGVGCPDQSPLGRPGCRDRGGYAGHQ